MDGGVKGAENFGQALARDVGHHEEEPVGIEHEAVVEIPADRARGLEQGEWIFIYHDNPEVTPPAQCRTDIGVTIPAQTRGEGEVETQLIPAGRYAQSRYLITDRNQYGPRWQEHIGDIVSAGLAFGDGPCFELYHSMSNDPLQDDVSFCSSVR